MESEKVKEIKEALAQNSGYIHFFNEYEVLDDVAYTDILTLINELESESERLVESCKNCHYIKDLEIANGHAKELKDRIAELETLCNKTYEDLTKEIDRLERENKELAKQVVKITGCSVSNEEVDYECNKKLKQFAERLKEISCEMYLKEQLHWCIDETLKEFIEKGDDN